MKYILFIHINRSLNLSNDTYYGGTRAKTNDESSFYNHYFADLECTDKLYVFLSPADRNDRRIRNLISSSLVRLAQYGNRSAKQEAMKLIRYTIDDWSERYRFMSRWEGSWNFLTDTIMSFLKLVTARKRR
jgi:hypothetical protein